ncbi:unnamed protein product [Dibothriocephalus latus]|uniref:SH2 domain-containing protein n=1 Tax=Dibothriocephalus latus TaxID=60516 RepID=A0A3P7LC05_DIBLA|nr:unnamed protein product [Dibothriocephalus latus]
MRVKRQEEQRRKAVAGARRSLHLNVHVGGGEFSQNLRPQHSVPGPVQPSNAEAAGRLSTPSAFRFAVGSHAGLLETSLVNGLDTKGVDEILQLQRAQGPDAIIEWFRHFEAPRLLRMFTAPGVSPTLQIPLWFHGILKRRQAEALLSGKAANSFLLRVSESFLGYVISHVGADGVCTHFFVQISKPSKDANAVTPEEEYTWYHLFGLPDRAFSTLGGLIEHYGVSLRGFGSANCTGFSRPFC